MVDVFLVTATTCPATFAAFEIIAHDSGRGAGHQNYAVPLEWLEQIGAIETELQALREASLTDFETVCIGEQTEAQTIVTRQGITLADRLLQRFFEEFV